MTLFSRFLTTSDAENVLDDASILAAMLRFEAALARAEAAEGLIPAAAADAIAAACTAEAFDATAILQEARQAGTLAIPLVRLLRERVERISAGAGCWVHVGSTSQDVMDTAMALVTREALGLVAQDLHGSVSALLGLAERHAQTPLLARTLLQPASVTSFGFRCAGWALPLARSLARLAALTPRALCVQLGGAAGTRAQLGAHAEAVVRRVAAELGLAVPQGVWHTQRDEWVALGCELGIVAGSLGKMAKDLSLMGQFEVGEVSEPGGGSSAMPHKQNPLGSMIALSAAQRAPHRVAALLAAMPQEHERALGGWQAELAEWGELLAIVHGSARAMATVTAALAVDAPRMRANLDAVRAAVPAEVAGEWFDPALAAALAGQVAALCAEVRETLPQ